MATSLVTITDVYKSFGSQKVLDGVSLFVENGENLVIFGRSGTGKSVLLKCMVGLMKPDKGTIIIDNKDVAQLSLKELNQLRKDISFLFQSAALYDSMSVKENLAFPLVKNTTLTRGEIAKKIDWALESVSLLDAKEKMPSELSGGMRKRIGLARAIITEPKLILYDEPTTGLDPITTKEISKLIRDLQKQLHITSVSVTHDLICAQIISDRNIVLNKGKIAVEGSIEDLMNTQDPFLKNFFSSEIIEHGDD